MTDIGQMFQGFQRDAWRLETLDTYAVGHEQRRIDEFTRTGRVPRKTIRNNDWMRTIAAARGRGATIGRVRLVGHPITPYTAFEFAAYPDNVRAGEAIEVVDRTWLDPSWSEAPDFWIFDDQHVYLMRYDEAGAFLGTEQAADPTPYLELRQRITSLAVPLDQYQLTDIPAPRSGTTTPTPLPTGIGAGGNRS